MTLQLLINACKVVTHLAVGLQCRTSSNRLGNTSINRKIALKQLDSRVSSLDLDTVCVEVTVNKCGEDRRRNYLHVPSPDGALAFRRAVLL